MKKFLIIPTLALVLALIPRISAFAQDDRIPSDLALDLVQAEQNPAPQRKQIVAAQKLKVELTTQEGKINVQAETKLDPEVATQHADQAEHPEQTTSEQVQQISITVTPTPTPSGNEETISPSETGGTTNLVPGTSVVEPDDNAAPPAPTTTPSETPANETVSPQETPSVETPSTETPNTPSNESTTTSPATEAPAAPQTTEAPAAPATEAPAAPPPANTEPSNPTPTVEGIFTSRPEWLVRILHLFIR